MGPSTHACASGEDEHMADATITLTPNRGRVAWAALMAAIAQHSLASVGFTIIVVLCALALLAPVLSPYDPYDQDLYAVLAGPSATHWLGTDNLGRDLLSRILYGARVSLFIGIAATFLSAVIGITIGLFAGFRGGLDRKSVV